MAMATAPVPASCVPQTRTGWGDVLGEVARALLGEVARDEEPLDLARALVDLRDARVAIVALDGIVVQVAVAAMDLDRLGAHPLGKLGGIELGLRRFRKARDALGAHAGRMQDEKPRRVDARMHVGEVVADRRMLD